MSLINVRNLTFGYEGSFDNIFENVSFQLDTNWKIGLTGRNGRGKTTFLNLLLGKYEYQGTITSSVNFEYFPFSAPKPEQSVFENALIIMPELQEWELEAELFRLELSHDILDRRFSLLSKGEQTKVMLAILFLKENSFLLIDEPTNHLDLKGRETVCRYLNRKKGFILVSHDRDFLDNCVDHIVSINRKDIQVCRGNFSSWYAQKEAEDKRELAENKRLKSQIDSLKRSAEEKTVWSDKVEKTKYGTRNSGLRPDRGYIGKKSAKMAKRSKAVQRNLETAADEKSKLLKNIEKAGSLKINQSLYHSKQLLSLKDVSIFYDSREICSGVTFSVNRGERVAVIGKNGSGKSSVLKLIAFGNIDYTGEFIKGSQLRISYVSQDTSFLKGSLSDYAAEKMIDESLFKTILTKLDFSRSQFEKNMGDYSEGQKKKVLIAGSLCENAHLLVWDEPLNYVDIISRIQIEELLLTYEPTILFVEHDRSFCDKTATKRVYI